MKINYQLELEKTIKEHQKNGKIPTLLLHSCCGPCSTYVLEYLSNYFKISVLYYNPNIYPSEEYFFREDEQKRLIEKMTPKYPIDFIPSDYDPKEYYSKVHGYQNEKEGGKRCELCFDLRIRQAGVVAKKMGFDYFTTTLSISPHKNSQLLNQIGAKISEEVGVDYLFSDFKKKNGFKRSVELTEEFDMYRQDYCGCIFSMREMQEKQREKEKLMKEEEF